MLPKLSYAQEDDPWFRFRLIQSLEKLSGRSRLENIYRPLKNRPFSQRHFFRQALDLAKIEYVLDGVSSDTIPSQGPLIFIANHPFGIVDGLMFCDIAAQTRGEFKIMIHERLCRDEQLNRYFLPVDFRPTRDAQRRNIESKRQAARLLKSGGTLLIFPGGGVASTGLGGFGTFDDLPWSTFTAKLVQQTQASVVPLFFHGRNSRLFHLANGISQTLRTALLLYEARNKIGKRFRVTLGPTMRYPELADKSRHELTQYLYQSTWSMAQPQAPTECAEPVEAA